MMEPLETAVGQPRNRGTSSEARTPRAMPMRPPKMLRATASARNWSRISSTARADGEADADLAGALGDADEHDVHDADAADEQRNAGDGAEQHGHDFGGLRGDFGDFLLGADEEVVFLAVGDAVTLAKEIHDFLLDDRHEVGARGLDEETAEGSLRRRGASWRWCKERERCRPDRAAALTYPLERAGRRR